MTEINLRLYISVFPRNSTEISVTAEGFMQTTILTRTLYFSDFLLLSFLILLVWLVILSFTLFF
uniref:Uncharacterized protein n=1 Tax=Meleagris gallopavo TaxID=9103 RepID=A0A803YIA8_MELGA